MNLQQYRIKRAKARQIIRMAKKKSWQNYVSKLNNRSPIKKCWDMIRKISGKGGGPRVKHLTNNGQQITDPKEIANTIGTTISRNSSSQNYRSKFKRIKTYKESKPLNFSSTNQESYNKPFTIEDLKSALDKSHDTAPGPDEIHYQILKHLPYSTQIHLIEIFNEVWINDRFPSLWREATIIPIPKPGKDATDSNNYCPIALTSCVCKTMERMINERLVWYLENSVLISTSQSGFRKTRSTIDHLVKLETFVREGFIKGDHVVAIFFDLEKAYDTTWKYGIMNDLYEMGLRGRLPHFIENFLSNRNFKVRIGSTLSDTFDQDTGVPQGSILSVILFIVKINSITNCMRPGIDSSLFVDDFTICYRSTSMITIERKIQQQLSAVERWADENGFKFSTTKTVCIHFCQRRGLHPNPFLTLYDAPIPVVDETKFLGLIFDSKLNFISHIKYIKKKCQKALDLLRVVAHTDWGGDRSILLQLYRNLVRSKLDYGCMIYGSARPSYIQMLNPIQNQGLRLCVGAFRTSPEDSLAVEANELPLSLCREKRALQYATKVAANTDNPAYNCIFNPNYIDLFYRKEKTIPTLGICIKESMEALHFNPNTICKFQYTEII